MPTHGSLRSGLFQYLKISADSRQQLLSGDGGSTQAEAERRLEIANEKSGALKKLRMFVLVYEDQSLDAAMVQEQALAQLLGSEKSLEVVLIF